MVALRDSQRHLKCLEGKARDICQSFDKAEKLLCPKGTGRLVSNVPHLPSSDEVKNLPEQMDADKETIRTQTQILRDIGPDGLSAPPN